jgi:caffeoyl-CoA O-methyltransferase
MLMRIVRTVLTPGQRRAIRDHLPGVLQTKPVFLWAPVAHYSRAYTTQPDTVLAGLTDATLAKNTPDMPALMQVTHDQGMLLTILTATAAPQHAIEVGTFTGYSALCIARGLPPGGNLLTLDIDEESTQVATRFWKASGVADRIELRLGPAADSLKALPEEPTFGLAFIDADKEGYIDYWDLLVPRMLPGALILVDNVLMEGSVAYPIHNPMVDAIRRFNDHVRADPRVEQVMLTIADGVTVARVLP